ncbi:MAG: fused MFS/spermidine synthase [Myxococcota bacterium]
MDLRFLLLLVCFFVSGFAALLYQTAWTREFAFLFGTSELAVVAVLAAYMGGLALGAAAASRFVGRLTRPVLAYGVLELGIAIGALCVPLFISIVQGVYLSLAGGLDAPPESMALTTALFHLAGSFLVLVPCTALMGATLPLLARYAVSEDAQVGPRIGILYAVNTFGAIAGTLVAAFVFLPEFGLRQTVYIGIAGNAVVFLAAAALARGLAGMPPEDEAKPQTSGGFHWILPAMTASGAVSFLYEVLWTRLLGQVLGGSTAAFASMLSSFLLGIALGSALASRFATTREAAARGFALVQLGIGVLAWIAFRASDLLPTLAQAVGASPAAPAPGAAAAGIVLLPVTLCIGATFPFAVRLLAQDADEAAAVSGRVYAWNTVGSIIGAILAGFFLLPLIGLENTATVGVVTSLLLAAAAAWFAAPRRAVLAGIAVAALALALVVGLPRPIGLLMHSAISGTRINGELYYLGVGRSATVTVVEHATGWRLLTNGLPESGVERAEVPDLRFNETAWLSLLPTAARPETKEMLIIGLGGAKTLEATASSVESIDVIELEEEVVTANRLIPRPTKPLDDPRVTLRLGDARGAMNLSKKTYDAIVSQPSHPWTSGASHLYTREFFELTHSKLNKGGIFIQWIGAGFVDVNLFGSLMASMTEVFPYVHVYRPVPAALVFMASDEPIDLLESAPRALAAAPDSFSIYGIHRVEDFLASWSLDSVGVGQLSENSPLNTDDHNRLATTRLPPSEAQTNRQAFDTSLAAVEVFSPERLAAVEAAAVLRRMTWNGERQRAQSLLQRLSPAARLATQGWFLMDGGRVKRAQAQFREALAIDPAQPSARAGLIASYAGGELDPASLSPREQAALKASERMAESDWAGLRAIDGELAQIQPGDLLFDGVYRARTAWRIEIGDAEQGREALVLIDRLLTRQRTPDHYFMRAKAGARAGELKIAWAALDQVAQRRRIRPQLITRSLALARSLGPPPPGAGQVIPRLVQQARAQR